MRVLISAGPTWEPIDPVRFIGNRSSGQMGAGLAEAALARGHTVTLVCGPGVVAMPGKAARVDIQSTADLQHALAAAWPANDLLIMAAAVADYRPAVVATEKLPRADRLTLALESTPDVVAALAAAKRSDQRVIAFSLESSPAAAGIQRAREKLTRKGVDLMVFNPADTIHSATIGATLLWPGGRAAEIPCRTKRQFADVLLEHAARLFE